LKGEYNLKGYTGKGNIGIIGIRRYYQSRFGNIDISRKMTGEYLEAKIGEMGRN